MPIVDTSLQFKDEARYDTLGDLRKKVIYFIWRNLDA